MKRRLHRILALAAVTGGLLASASFAHARQNVTLHLHNTSQSDEMTCRVYRVVTNSSGRDVETLLHTLDVKPKSERAERVLARCATDWDPSVREIALAGCDSADGPPATF